MGWTFEACPHIKRKDVRTLIDSKVNGTVLKSAMIGNTYYAAVRDNHDTVYGLVVLTLLRNSDAYNLGMKFEKEDMGPCEAECPVSILDLLSDTDNTCSISWRQRCRAYNERVKTLRKLPIGSKVTTPNGRSYFKNTASGRYQWMTGSGNYYIPAARLARAGFTIRKGETYDV